MISDLDELDIEQQAHMLQVIGRIMTEMYRSGKTEIPEGSFCQTLRDYARHLAFRMLDQHGYPGDMPFVPTGSPLFEEGSSYGEGRI